MFLKDLVRYTAEALDLTQVQAQETVIAVLQGIMDLTVSNGSLDIRGFGKFSIVDQGERKFYNPLKGEYGTKPAGKKLKFKYGNIFKDSV